MKKAVLFDMDGVLIDTEIVFARCLSRAFSEAGYPIPEEEFYRFAGIEYGKKMETLIRERGLSVGTEELTRYYRQAQAAELRDFGPLLKPGVLPLLRQLRGEGYLTALCSNSIQSRVEKVFADTGMEGLFDLVVTGENVPLRKPDPGIYLLALERLALSAGECLAVEDSIFGLTAARAAGLTVVEVRDERFPYREGLADHTIVALSQLPPVLKAYI